MAVLNGLLIPLAAIPGVNTCRLGLEANLTLDDYPIIRLVPGSLAPSSLGNINGPRILSLTVYFGAQLLEATDGLAAVYAELFRLDVAIREALLVTAITAGLEAGRWLQITYRDTVMDEDRLPHYKIMAARFEVVG